MNPKQRMQKQLMMSKMIAVFVWKDLPLDSVLKITLLQFPRGLIEFSKVSRTLFLLLV